MIGCNSDAAVVNSEFFAANIPGIISSLQNFIHISPKKEQMEQEEDVLAIVFL